VTRLQTRSCYETTADHVVGNVVGGLNLIRILRIDDEIVESRKSRARARALGFLAPCTSAVGKDWLLASSEWMKAFALIDLAFITRTVRAACSIFGSART